MGRTLVGERGLKDQVASRRPIQCGSSIAVRCPPMSRERANALLERLGADLRDGGEGDPLESVDPATGQVLGRIRAFGRAQYDACVAASSARFQQWRMRPAPKRGEVVRALGELLRAHKEA